MKHSFPKKIVAIHAHPDDTEIFSAGTMALMKAKGYELAIVTMTPGGLGGIGSTERRTIETRKREAAIALQAELARQARDPALLQQAQDNARHYLESLLGSSGVPQVSIRFDGAPHPPAPRPVP